MNLPSLAVSLSAPLSGALRHRHAELLYSIDRHLARRMSDDAIRRIDDRALFERAMTMLVTEVLVNVAIAMRALRYDDHRLEAIVSGAFEAAVEAREKNDRTRRERAQ